MTKNEVIYVAKPTWYTEKIYPGHAKFYEHFLAQLREYHEVRALELSDIWVRDFLPLQNVQTGELYQQFFNPRYANYTPKFTAAIRKQVRGAFPHAQPCDARIDGGNIVLTPDKKQAFCLEKQTIFRKSNPAQKEHVEQELKRALGVEEILWFPQQNGDKIGHMDGYIQFLGDLLMEGTTALYGGVATEPLLDDKATDILRSYGKFERIPLLCQLDEEDWLSARGLYVNFLETSRAVFVPQFNLPDDDEIVNIMKKHTRKPLVRVDCEQISQYGGAVHCLTREYDG